MTFREIAPADLPAIFDVRIATWHNPHGAEELNRLGINIASVDAMLQAGTHKGWLCEMDGAFVGFAMGDRSTGEMWVIAVLKACENRGIGRTLLERVETWLWSCGWEEIWLTTDVDESMRAVGFYRHLDWRDWKIEDGDRFMRKKKPLG